ncbi:helix-turn-helix transcriptional regulator [Nakamurella antarctica]|uniref:helix-turn-helix transcriptional regulator n=1 Tax=Nakamurella antarctica TaxID=1902245 RepID=UPI0019D03227|nr:metalloregulator ArsR/SmtB family transcription factor [Nakamurella antarctica]
MNIAGATTRMGHTPAADGSTRQAVVQLLIAEGPTTAVVVAEKLRLSAAGIRRHLDALVDEGSITSRMESMSSTRGRGRPARVYLLTGSGREKLPHAYDDIAVEALAFLAVNGGPDAVKSFARQRAEKVIATRRDDIVAADSMPAKLAVLASALTDSGYMASTEQVGIGDQLCQHHCPVAHVATQFPQLCEEEMHVFSQALGTNTQRLATIARGDSFCTIFVPPSVSLPLSAPPVPLEEVTHTATHRNSDATRTEGSSL